MLDKKQFDEIFSSSIKEHTLDKAEFLKTLENYLENDKTISTENLALILFLEGQKYTEDLLYSVLLKVLNIS